MSEILCVTNRILCRDDFLKRIEKIAAAGPRGIILREKDLSEDAYKALAEQVLAVCRRAGTLCILHSFAKAARALKADAVHLPLPVLKALSDAELKEFPILGTSCHSAEDAKYAEERGCTYLLAGHIFETASKKGLPGRGTDFLKEVCESTSLPVYAIGGIAADNIAEVKAAGAKGACVMSGIMTCEDIPAYLNSLM